MTRTIDPVAHAVRRDAFVDAAQRLMQAKGYDQMSIQDVLDEVGTSKGAFYHYFDSKSALLEAVVERMVDGAVARVTPLVADSETPALGKLEGMFTGIADFKTERTELVLALLQVWTSDENAIVREKLRKATLARLAPLLAAIVRQGKDDGVFTAGQPDDVARVLWSLLLGANETATELYLARQAGEVSFGEVEGALTSYVEAFERILGLPPRSLRIFEPALLRTWYG
jgi:AcrR family transcriptional regulator